MLGENGIIGKAKTAKEAYANSVITEQAEMDALLQDLEEIMPSPISTTDSYVGYYADKEGNGTVDGIIFADLRKGNTGSGQWGDGDGIYTIPTIGSSKEYYVKEANYAGSFGEHPVIAPVAGTTGNDRFYIMALSDVSADRYYWYYNAYNAGISDYATKTSTSFGSGSTNTTNMIDAWNAGTYGAKVTSANPVSNRIDMWNEVETGWFIPSKEEWSAFAGELGIDSSNYNSSTNNLSYGYWPSSLDGTYTALGAYFSLGRMYGYSIASSFFVRLASTF